MSTITRTEVQRDALEAKRAEFARERHVLAELKARLERLDAELLDWQTLQRVFSRDGLPDLEIDAAGPAIATMSTS